jgi:predicted SAM-dependent methyltransferase
MTTHPFITDGDTIRQVDYVFVELGAGESPYVPVGNEPLPIMVDIRKSLTPPDILCDITKGLPFKDSSVDKIYTAHVLEHLFYEDSLKVIDEIYRVLKKDGVVKIIVPDLIEGIQALFDGKFKDAMDTIFSKPYSWWRKEDLLFASHKCGFTTEMLRNIMFTKNFRTLELRTTTERACGGS